MRNMTRRAALVLSLSCSLAGLRVAAVAAHEMNTSYTEVELRTDSNEIVCKLVLDITDLEQLFELDADDNGVVSADELSLLLPQVQSHFLPKIIVRNWGERIELVASGAEPTEDGLGNTFAQLTFRQSVPRLGWKMHLRIDIFSELSRRHKNLVKVTRGSETLQAILTRDYPEQTFSFDGADISLFAQCRQFVWLGIEHILIGYDHILFVLGLILIGGRMSSLVKMVTAFTVAHSLTLVLAALQLVILPGRLVESVIALSIVYIAVENFFVKGNEQRWIIAFIFGLMHGFGFANVLAELGLPGEGLVASLFSFNVGVELGQVAIVAACYPAIMWLARSPNQRRIVFALSSVILFFGLAWFVQRALGLEIPMV